jgi:hypothetical protein
MLLLSSSTPPPCSTPPHHVSAFSGIPTIFYCIGLCLPYSLLSFMIISLTVVFLCISVIDSISLITVTPCDFRYHTRYSFVQRFFQNFLLFHYSALHPLSQGQSSPPFILLLLLSSIGSFPPLHTYNFPGILELSSIRRNPKTIL